MSLKNAFRDDVFPNIFYIQCYNVDTKLSFVIVTCSFNFFATCRVFVAADITVVTCHEYRCDG